MRICELDGCNRNHEARGYCRKHSDNVKKWGVPDPLPEFKRALRAAFLPCCQYCDEKVTSKKSVLCKFHAGRKNRGLDIDAPRKQYHLGNPGYGATHDRVRKERGPASLQACVDCGDQARDWALKPNTEDIVIQQDGANAGRTFSRDVNDYEPRCRPCHINHDTENHLQRAKHGRAKKVTVDFEGVS